MLQFFLTFCNHPSALGIHGYASTLNSQAPSALPPPTPQPGSRHPPRDCECSPAPAPASKGEWSSGRPTFMTAGSTGLDRTMRFRPLNMLQRQ